MAHGEPGPGLKTTDGGPVDSQKLGPERALRVADSALLEVLGEILLELKKIRLAQEIQIDADLTNEDF